MVVETRSQRQAQLQRPPYPSFTNPQHTGETHSVFQSSSSSLSSESSIASPSSAAPPTSTMTMQDPSSPDMMMLDSASHEPAPFNGAPQAPLPSPTDGSYQPTSYFGSIDQQSQSAAAATAASQMAYAPQHRFPVSQGPTAVGDGGGARCAAGPPASYVGQRGNEGGVPETAPFLQDFNLVAEAAKRAQMACLERDLGECGL
ncbi:hypothetical protein KC338_g7248 [Hortaea werneckii]|nr:hypothetical protein KC338_g7248 [Hortaea werneckii]